MSQVLDIKNRPRAVRVEYFHIDYLSLFPEKVSF